MIRTATYSGLLLLLAMIPAFPVSHADGSPPVSSVRFNQLGFEIHGPKRAIVRDDATTPLEWQLLGVDGAVKVQGQSQVFGKNAASGEHLHIVDFSAFRTSGSNYRLVVGKHESRSFPIADGLLAKLKYDAIAYFYHNRSGAPIEAKHVGEQWARPAGHAPEIVSCFDKKDERDNEWPGCDYELDATGGWYDAGDHGKYVVNAGISVWTLLNYYERTLRLSPAARAAFADGTLAIPERGNGISDLLDEVRWELNFMLGMQAPEGAKLQTLKGGPPGAAAAGEFFEIDASGMAHHKLHGEQWTPLPSAPHEDTKPRYAFPPSTTATLNLAATAAQCARIWRDIDEVFSKRCLTAAERAYEAAKRNPDLLAVGGFDGGGGYGDGDVSDEFYWAAAELFVTTGDKKYAADLQASPHYLAAPREGEGEIAWPQVRTLGTISLAVVPNRLAAAEIARAHANLIAAADRYLAQAKREGYAIPYASTAYRWGSNSDVLNRAIVLGLAFDFTGKTVYRDRVVDAMDYVLGRNPLDQSYVSGHGMRPMRNPHHRHWAKQKNADYPPPPPGALSGGPNSTSMIDPIAAAMKGRCEPQMCWQDHVDAYALNEVAINWNAPLVWVAAFLDER